MIKNAIVSFLLVCLLLWLPFDLQFKSPFIPIERLKVKVSPEGNQANRVVLITVDGMIAKSMKFNITPFLFQKIQDGGRMGYSWTKAPVESRPAHQAILGGFWEDPSNILRLWRRSKGNEDHILKIIPNVLALGGPDV